MKPPKRDINYEKVKCDDFIQGEIDSIQYDENHKFGFEGKEKIAPAVRFIFALDGYEFKHYSRWMTFSYGEKTNLYLKYLTALVEGAQPDMDFDLDSLKGMKVRVLWSEKNDFQFVETIRPVGKKIQALKTITDSFADDDLKPDDEVPF